MRDYGPASVVRADDHGRALAGVSGAHRRNVTDRLSFPGNMWTLGIIPLYAVGAWLAWRLPTHPQAVRLLVAGTAATVPGAFGHSWPASHS